MCSYKSVVTYCMYYVLHLHMFCSYSFQTERERGERERERERERGEREREREEGRESRNIIFNAMDEREFVAVNKLRW